LNTNSSSLKWIALLVGMFLLSASLDNVPDCPELLNQGSVTSTSSQFASHLAAIVPDHRYARYISAFPLLTSHHPCEEELEGTFLSGRVRSLEQAANSSPPSA
jgi:hypothetical protein